jgi:Na+-driven multidrug efflux pump
MALIVTLITQMVMLSRTYEPYSTGLGLLVVLLLVTLLVQKELLRALGDWRSSRWLSFLDFAIAPLALIFGLIMLLRLFNLIIPR